MIPQKEIVIGKDILELLTSSMYVNPLSIYREYIQNSVDSIDEAIAEGILSDRQQGRIDISLDHINRKATIHDNGIGINKENLLKILASFGQSYKRQYNARGFRGVGRLAGLGYCQELVFRSRNTKDSPVYELKWDCKLLKKLLKDHTYSGQLVDIAGEVISLSACDSNDYPERFFEVDIIKPIRIGKDVLLNDKIISEYLSQVSPVPISDHFSFKSEIDNLFEKYNLELTEYNIFINNSDLPLTRLFKNQIYYSDTRIGKFTDIEQINVSDPDNNLAAVGWIAHHDYQGTLPKNLGVRGFRSRVGNIQIGEEDLFVDLFSEDRFNSWTIGEIHIIDRQVIPNGRRDNFETNIYYTNLKNYLIPHFNDIAKRCRTSSQIRNRIKIFKNDCQKIDESLKVLEQGIISNEKSKQYIKEIGTRLREIQNVLGFDLLNNELNEDLKTNYEKLVGRANSVNNNNNDDPLKSIPKQKRAIYKEVFDLIYDCSSNTILAKTLIDKIIARIAYN